MTVVRSLRNPRDDATKAERAVVRSLTGPSPSPSSPADPREGYHLQGADFMHVYVDLDGATGMSVTPWFYNDSTQIWHEDTSLTMVFTGSQTRFNLEVRGEERVFFAIDTLTGTPVTAALVFAGYSFEQAQG